MIPTNASKNQAIIVVLFVILVSTTIAPLQMASAKNTYKSTLTSAVTTTTKIFNIYNTHVLGFNETKGVLEANLTSDQYSLQTILVNQGDKVIVNLYNMEAPSGDMHSFTIDAPYNVSIDITPRHNGTETFIADHPGIFKFYCKHHLPGMVGELIVLPNKT
jgi:nitrous oxide reductase